MSHRFATAVWLLLLALLLLLLLGYGMHSAGLAAVFSDSVSGIRAQDETTYASSAAGFSPS